MLSMAAEVATTPARKATGEVPKTLISRWAVAAACGVSGAGSVPDSTGV